MPLDNTNSKWFDLQITPPDKIVEVLTTNHDILLAQPTYYPFKVVNNPNKPGKWGSNIEKCEPYWDGGWLVETDLSTTNNDYKIIAWRFFDGEQR